MIFAFRLGDSRNALEDAGWYPSILASDEFTTRSAADLLHDFVDHEGDYQVDGETIAQGSALWTSTLVLNDRETLLFRLTEKQNYGTTGLSGVVESYILDLFNARLGDRFNIEEPAHREFAVLYSTGWNRAKNKWPSKIPINGTLQDRLLDLHSKACKEWRTNGYIFASKYSVVGKIVDGIFDVHVIGHPR